MGPSAPGRFRKGANRLGCQCPLALVKESDAAGFTRTAPPSIVTVAGDRWLGPTVTVKPSTFCVWIRSSLAPRSLLLNHAASMDDSVPGVKPSITTQYAEPYR